MKTHFLLAALAALVFACPRDLHGGVEAQDARPAVPDGFSWRRLEDVRIDVLVPNGWLVTPFEEKGTVAYKITTDKTYQTGLTINIITDVSNKTEKLSAALGKTVNAPLYAVYQIEQYKKNSTTVLDEWHRKSFPFLICGCEVLKDIDGVESHIRSTAIGNVTTDTLYVWMFGSPASSWEDAWAFGEKMLNPILVDREF